MSSTHSSIQVAAGMDIARKVLPKGAKSPSTHKHLGIVGNTMTEKSVDTTKTTNI